MTFPGLNYDLSGPQNIWPCSVADEFDELLSDNRKVILRNIADELRVHLPPDAMLPSENTAYAKVPQ